MKNIFEKPVTDQVIERIMQLTTNSKAAWGKMNVGQMLAHVNVQYEMVYEPEKFPKPNGFTRFMLKMFVKKIVTGPKPYKKNSRTAPQFLMTEPKDFLKEKNRLIDYIKRTQQNGVAVLLPIDNASFGVMTESEWNALFYKHLNHHLEQFSV